MECLPDFLFFFSRDAIKVQSGKNEKKYQLETAFPHKISFSCLRIRQSISSSRVSLKCSKNTQMHISIINENSGMRGVLRGEGEEAEGRPEDLADEG